MAAILTRNKDAVIENFGFQGKPMFAIFEGNKILFCCCNDDEKVREQTLKQYLEYMETGGTTASFDLKFYDECNKNGKVTNATPFFGSLPFKISDSDAALNLLAQKQQGGGNMTAQSMQLMMQIFEQKIDNVQLRNEYALQKKDEEIAALEEELNAPPEHNYEKAGLGKIGAITDMIGSAGEKYPWMQETVKDIMSTLKNLVNGASTKYASMTERPVQMSGIPPKPASGELTEQLKWSQQTLISFFRKKNGVETNDNGTAKEGHEAGMQKADQEYVAAMVKLAEVASTKPKTFSNALESLQEL